MTQILLSIPKKDWRTPSQAQQKNSLGHENQTRFRFRALTHDGVPRWIGWFDDRDDADAFLWAIASGSLPYERELWDLPVSTWMPGYGYSNVGWRPDLGEGLLYDFATVVFVVSGASWSVPSDCSGVSGGTGEFIDTIGGGGGGGAESTAGVMQATGAGGAAWSRVTTGVVLTPGGSATIQVGTGGTGLSIATNIQQAGNAGTDTFFNGASLGASSVGAKGGSGGPTPVLATPNAPGGAGGAAASGVGASKNSGGNGGLGSAAGSGAQGTGGGGAAGPNGNGLNGAQAAGSSTASAGGNGDNGSGGAGSAGVAGVSGTTSAGGNGTEYDATHGSGGGSGGKQSTSTSITSSTGVGGNYGGGAGSLSSAQIGVTTGGGGPGLIVVSYNPALKKYIPNLAMLGW